MVIKLNHLYSICLIALLFSLTISLVGCQNNKDVSGIWQGNILESSNTAKPKKDTQPKPTPVEILLSQNGTTVNGTLTLALPNQPNKIDAVISAGVFTDGQLSFKASTNGLAARLDLDFNGQMSGRTIQGKGTMKLIGMLSNSSQDYTLEVTKK